MHSTAAPAPSPEASALLIEAALAQLRADRLTKVDARAAIIVRNAQVSGDPALSAGITTLGVEIGELDREIAGHCEALERVREAIPALEAERERAETVAVLARSTKNARAVRKAASSLDDALDAAAAAHADLRTALAKLNVEADASVRAAEGFEMLTLQVQSVPTVVQARLAHGGVLPARSVVLDRSGPPPSVREQLDRAIFGLLRLQGRPKGSSGSEAGDE